MKLRRTVFICGGGTGGHLFPALAIGQKLRLKAPYLEIIFVGSQRQVERAIMAKSGEKFVALKLEGLSGRGWRAIFCIPLVPISLLKSIYLLLKKWPALVIGVGGYSSGPMVLAAWLLQRPRLILEQNARPGFTNRILRHFVSRAVVAFEGTLPYFGSKAIYLGNPVRPAFYSIQPRKEKTYFSLLIFGGSQGSHFLNQLMVNSLTFISEAKDKIRILHQTGSKDYDWVERAYRNFGLISFEVAPFFFDMPERFAAADLIICRAGASSVAEIIACRRASILIPFAGAAENHQYWNAHELFSRGAADLLLEKEARPQALAQKILDYLEHPEKLNLMEEKLASLQIAEPEEKIVSLCLDLMKSRRN